MNQNIEKAKEKIKERYDEVVNMQRTAHLENAPKTVIEYRKGESKGLFFALQAIAFACQVEAQRRAETEPQKICEWKFEEKDPDIDGLYETDCGNAFQLTEGTPSENRMTYCPYCGGKIEVKE